MHRGRLFRNAVGVAVNASYEMDVVETLEVLECGVHGFDGDAAIGEARMAGAAGRTRLLAMLEVTGKTTESFVHADGSAVVTGVDLSSGSGRVALVAQSLALVGTDRNRVCSVEHFRERKFRDRNVNEFAAVKKSQ